MNRETILKELERGRKKLKDEYQKAFDILLTTMRYSWLPETETLPFLKESMDKMLQAQRDRQPVADVWGDTEQYATSFVDSKRQAYSTFKKIFEVLRLVPIALFFYSMASFGISWISRGIFESTWSLNHAFRQSDLLGSILMVIVIVVLTILVRKKPLLFMTQSGAVKSFLRSLAVLLIVLGSFFVLALFFDQVIGEINIALYLSGLLILSLLFRQLEQRIRRFS